MKNELSLIDLHFIVKELQPLVGSIIDKIFQYDKEVYFRLHSSKVGKKILVITKSLLFLSSKKKDSEKLHGFCAFLRKYLTRARLRSIEQLPGERIVKIVWDHKKNFIMYIELFNKGNIVLCDENNSIVGVLSKQKWADRSVLPKEKYFFTSRKDIFSLSEKEFVSLLKDSKDNISKTVACYFGRVYAVELCVRAGVNLVSDVSVVSLKKIYKKLHELLARFVEPVAYYSDKEVKDIVPFPFKTYEGVEKKNFSTLSEAYEEQFVKTIPKKEGKFSKKLLQSKKKILAQQKNLVKQEKIVIDNQRIGELVYENYQIVQEVIETFRKAREKHSWKEIKEKLKGHKVVKSIDESTGNIEIEL